MPRTIPMFRVIRNPGNSKAIVIRAGSIRRGIVRSFPFVPLLGTKRPGDSTRKCPASHATIEWFASAAMQQAFYILGTVQVLAGLWALVQGFQWLAMVRRRLARHPGFLRATSCLICPCKGNEAGLDTNLAALASQDYSSYEIFFVLARADDPSRNVIEGALQGEQGSGASGDCRKAGRLRREVNNLRVAVEQLGRTLMCSRSPIRMRGPAASG